MDRSQEDMKARLKNQHTIEIVNNPIRGSLTNTVFRVGGALYPFGRNRYFAYVLSRFGAKFAGNAECTLGLNGGGKFVFPMGDKYWIKLLMPGFQYEPEVDFFVEHAASHCKKALLVDCGANFGYWVARTAGMKGLDVVAIEPSPTALSFLRKNMQCNTRAVLYQNAVWKKSGEPLQFASSSKVHAGSALASVARHSTDQGDWSVTTVDSIAIDTIVAKHRTPEHEIVIIKLDVEGAEVDAIEGGKLALQSGEAVLVYEDHASDPEHLISRYLTDLGMSIFSFQGRSLVKIQSLDEMDALKAPKKFGYNFYNFAACLGGSKGESILQDAIAK